MASSNRHWPSMFKSKPCNNQWQQHHEINPSLISTSCHKPSYTSGCEERSPEPKPRWNPKPEQIRILEAIFNSGMVNPPRDEIRKIRAQLQEFGQVGDANVFYWFQNRKSRSKHKLRNLQNSKHQQNQQNQQQQQQQNPPMIFTNNNITAPSPAAAAAANSSSSSSSEKLASPKGCCNNNNNNKMSALSNFMDVSNLSSPTASVNQTMSYFHNNHHQPAHQTEFLNEPGFFFPVPQHQQQGGTTGFGFSELANVIQVPEVQQPSLLLSEILNHGANSRKVIIDDREEEEEKLMKMQLHLSYSAPPSTETVPSTTAAITTVSSNNHPNIQGVGESGGAARTSPLTTTTVFINDVAFEVAVGPFNVREAFGDDAMLLNSSGQPVLTNDWGLTLQSLQHGGFYYLVRSLSPFSV